ncbi:MAG: PAS domain S-box protein [Pseudomonadota bacterium]
MPDSGQGMQNFGQLRGLVARLLTEVPSGPLPGLGTEITDLIDRLERQSLEQPGSGQAAMGQGLEGVGETLLANEERCQLLVETMNDGLGVMDERGVLTYVNDKLLQMMGFSREETIGRRVVDFLDQENLALFQQRSLLCTGSSRDGFEIVWTVRDGRRVPTFTSPQLLFDAQGVFAGAFAVISDLTQRQRSREAHRESERTLRAMVDANPEVFVLLDTQGRVLIANQALASKAGRTTEEMVGVDIFSLIPDQTMAENRRWLLEQVVRTGQPCQVEDELPGVYRDMRFTPVVDDQGQVSKVAVLGIDITQRKRSEDALREARDQLENRVRRRTEELEAANRQLQEEMARRRRIEEEVTRLKEFYQSIIEGIPTGVWVSDEQDHIYYLNRAMGQIAGVPAERLWGGGTPTEPLPELPAHLRDYYFKAKEIMIPVRYEGLAVPGLDGGLRFQSGWLIPLGDQGGFEGMVCTVEDITDGRQAQEALGASEELFRLTFDQSPLGAAYVGFDFAINRANQALCLLSGYSDRELQGRRFETLFLPKDLARMAEQGWRLFLGEISEYQGEHRLVGKSGQIIWVRLSLYLLKDPQGEPLHFVPMLEDITERKQAQEALHRKNRALRALSRAGLAAVQSQGETELMERICRIAVEVSGYSLAWVGLAEQDEEKRVRPLAHCGLPEGYLEKIKITWADEPLGRGPTGRAIRGGRPVVARDLLKQPDYEPWREIAQRHGLVSSVGLPLMDGQSCLGALTIYAAQTDAFDEEEVALLNELGQILALGIIALRDRRERHWAETRLSQSQAMLQRVFGASPVWLALTTAPEGRFIMVNQAFLSTTGYDEQEVLGRTVKDLGLWPDHAQWVEAVRVAKEQGGLRDYEIALRMKDGQERRFLWYAEPIAVGVRPCLISALLDVTKRKRTEDELRQNEETLRMMFDHLPLGMMRFDMGGVIIDCNDQLASILGVPRERLLGLKLPESVQDGPARQSLQDALTTGEGFFEGPYTTATGRKGMYLRAHHRLMNDGRGRPVGGLGLVEDITQRRQLQEQLRLAQKMEALATLAGGIAHDFNNILAIILTNCELSLLDLPQDHRAQRPLGRAIKASLRGKELVDQILTLSRRRELDRRPLYPLPIIKEVLKLLRSTLPASVEMVSKLGGDTLKVEVDPTELHQVLMNLCTNAAQAMLPRGGSLEVETGQINLGTERAAFYSDLAYGHYLVLSVSDTGQGIEPAHLEKIFDPYFTTKPHGEGTGLGLAVVQGIVEGYGGKIHVYSELGHGTTFRVYLPVVEGQVGAAAPGEPAPPSGDGHVLLVDDEPDLVAGGQAVLEGLGYRVTAFTDSRQALQALEDSPEAFDVVLSDRSMPGLSGESLAARIKLLRPGLPVVLCTGFKKGLPEELLKELGIASVVGKPYSRRELALALAKALRPTQKP